MGFRPPPVGTASVAHIRLDILLIQLLSQEMDWLALPDAPCPLRAAIRPIAEYSALLDELDSRLGDQFFPRRIAGLDHAQDFLRENVQIPFIRVPDADDQAILDEMGVEMAQVGGNLEGFRGDQPDAVRVLAGIGTELDA